MIYRALIIGLGNVGIGYDLGFKQFEKILTLGRAFHEHENFELVGGVDTDPDQCKLFEKYYLRPSYPDIEVAINEVDPHVIIISAPTEHHFGIYCKVMSISKPLAILCEKPLSYDLKEAEYMVSNSVSSNVILLTNYMRRCDPAVINVRDRIERNEISGPFKGVCWYSKGLFNNGSHFVNLFQYLLGEVVDFKIVNQGRFWMDHDPEPDVLIKHELGEIYLLAAREEMFSHYTVELIAANGRLRYEKGRMVWQKASVDITNSKYILLEDTEEVIDSSLRGLQWQVADEVSKNLAHDKSSVCTGEQGLSTLKVLTQIKDEL